MHHQGASVLVHHQSANVVVHHQSADVVVHQQRAMKRKGGHRLCSFVSGWPLLKGGAVNWEGEVIWPLYSQPLFSLFLSCRSVEFICASSRIFFAHRPRLHEDDFVEDYCLFLYERRFIHFAEFSGSLASTPQLLPQSHTYISCIYSQNMSYAYL